MNKLNRAIQKQKMVSTYPNRGITLVKGEGVFLYDDDGKKYLDMMSNFGVNIFGYSHPAIINQLELQLSTLSNLHSSFNNDRRSEALKKLVQALKDSGFSQLNRIYWGNSGTEAVEAAIKFAIQASGRNKFIAAHNSYHGKTLGALSVTDSGDGKYREPFATSLIDVDFVEYGDINEIRQKLNEEYAAVILESIQGEGGFIMPPINYLIEVSKICKKNGILLIIDDIQTGMGRTGHFLNSEQYCEKGFEPDMVCMAKGLGGGVPVSATAITNEINSKLSKGIHTSTFGGNPLSMAGVIATLGLLRDHEIMKEVGDIGRYFIEQLKASNVGIEVRGTGLMIGVEMENDPIPIIRALQNEGILVAPSSGNTIRFLPPLIIEREHIDFTIGKLRKCAESSQ